MNEVIKYLFNNNSRILVKKVSSFNNNNVYLANDDKVINDDNVIERDVV